MDMLERLYQLKMLFLIFFNFSRNIVSSMRDSIHVLDTVGKLGLIS